MTDERSRPDEPKRAQPAIEVPLTGDGPLSEHPIGSKDEPAPPNWRRIVGLSSLAGIALGIIASVVLIRFV